MNECSTPVRGKRSIDALNWPGTSRVGETIVRKLTRVSGPIRIAQVSGVVASSGGLLALVNLAAILSVSIGLMNLFPVPMLDGGHLMFYLVEALRGRPLSERAQEIGFRLGLGLVLMLMLFVTWNDIIHVRSLL